jgi:beta-mannosidase
MERQVKQLFGCIPKDPDTYILASQISQAEAKKFFIERVRIGRPEKSGIIWWNLLDGWPQMSDAVVDYYYEKKLAYGYIKNSQAPFTIICGELSSNMNRFYACNDTLTERSGHFTVKDAMTDELLFESDFIAKANTTTQIGALREFYSTQRILAIEWSEGGRQGFNHYLCGFPPISLELYTEFLKKYKEKI